MRRSRSRICAVSFSCSRKSWTTFALGSIGRPRAWASGNALRGRASSAIDISDGLVADAGHIAERSGARLVIEWEAVPLSPVAQRYREHPLMQRCALAGGDDYELCFTAASSDHGDIAELAGRLGLALTRVGRVEQGAGVAAVDADGQALTLQERGFDHFR